MNGHPSFRPRSHQRAPQRPSDRRWMHGPLQPMPADDPAADWPAIGKLAALAVAIIAFTWIVIPGLAALTLDLIR